MARQISWRNIGNGVWRTSIVSPKWQGTNFDIVFQVTAGVTSNFKITNARLEILKPIKGKRGQYEVLRSKSFSSSWRAKETVDCLLFLARHNHIYNDDGFSLLFDTFDRLTDTPAPEQPNLTILPEHLYSYRH